MNRNLTRRIASTLAALAAACCATLAGTNQASPGRGTTQDDFFKAGEAEVSRGGLFSEGAVKWQMIKETGALTVLLGGAVAELGNTTDPASSPLSATWVGAFRIPVALPTHLRGPGAAQQLRGAVKKDADARVTLALNLGGDTPLGGRQFVVVFPYGKSADEPQFLREFPLRTGAKSEGHYSVAVVVTIERRKPGAMASLHLDSLDLTGNPKGGKKAGARAGK